MLEKDERPTIPVDSGGSHSSTNPEGQREDLTGRTLDDFRVLRRLGQGGMGQVYLAEQVSLKRRVALKILKTDLGDNLAGLRRFQVEAEVVARATHANIVQVYATGSAEGVHYMALEYVEGRNLREYLARKGPPDLPRALSIMSQVASALQRAAELGIIHRDIKPENILLTRKGEVKVADFGLSRSLEGMGPALNLTQSGVTMGTPLYMSPEQVEGKPLDQRTDIYSFGVTCYHMLAGQPPFRGQSAFEVALQHVRAEPAALSLLRPDLPPGLARIVHKMMAKKTEERYQNFRELLQDLNRLGEEASATGQQEGNLQTPIIPIPINGDSLAMATATSPTSPPQPATLTILTVQAKPTAGHARRRGLLATAILVALLIGAGAAWWRLHPASPKTASPPASGDVGEVNALFSESELEKFLIRAVDKYANPEGDPNQIRLGIGHCTELLVFYLERHRLDEADRFLDRLDNPGQKVRPYKALGRLGHAIVLALQDRPEESNQLFLQLLKETKNERDRFLQGFWFTQNPSLRFWVARALDYNKENTTSKHPFPVQLEFLRRPTVLPPFPPPRRLPGERRQGD